MTRVLAALLAVTVGVELVVVVGSVWQPVEVDVKGVVVVVSLGPTGVTVVMPEGPTVVIAVDVVVVAPPPRAVVMAVKHGGEAAGGSIELPVRSPAEATPAIPSASRATAAKTRRATRPR
jgi:hypothetical protein